MGAYLSSPIRDKVGAPTRCPLPAARPTERGLGGGRAVPVCARQGCTTPRSHAPPSLACHTAGTSPPLLLGTTCAERRRHASLPCSPAGVGRGRERCLQVRRFGDAGLADRHGAPGSRPAVPPRKSLQRVPTPHGCCCLPAAHRRPLGSPCLICLLLQEDAHAALLDLPDGNTKGALFAVLDGHGGAEVARFVANHLVCGCRSCCCWAGGGAGGSLRHGSPTLQTMPLFRVPWRAQAGSWHRRQLGQWRLPPWFLCKPSSFCLGSRASSCTDRSCPLRGTIRSALEPLSFPLTALCCLQHQTASLTPSLPLPSLHPPGPRAGVHRGLPSERHGGSPEAGLLAYG